MLYHTLYPNILQHTIIYIDISIYTMINHMKVFSFCNFFYHSFSIYKFISILSQSSSFLSLANQLLLSPLPCLSNSLKIALSFISLTFFPYRICWETNTRWQTLFTFLTRQYWLDLCCRQQNQQFIRVGSLLFATPRCRGVQVEMRRGESVALFTWPQAAINVYQMCNAQSSRGRGSRQIK